MEKKWKRAIVKKNRRGIITIPSTAMDYAGLSGCSHVSIELVDGGVILRPASKAPDMPNMVFPITVIGGNGQPMTIENESVFRDYLKWCAGRVKPVEDTGYEVGEGDG